MTLSQELNPKSSAKAWQKSSWKPYTTKLQFANEKVSVKSPSSRAQGITILSSN